VASEITVREIDTDNSDDVAFVTDSWIRSYLGPRHYDRASYDVAARNVRDVVSWVVGSFTVAIAECDGELIGWIAFDHETHTLFYVYVKLRFRRNGYATRMVQDLVRGDDRDCPIRAAFQTPAMHWMAPRWGAVVDEWDALDQFMFATQGAER
jgi:GNAT superfamily N-acetyltransferase